MCCMDKNLHQQAGNSRQMIQHAEADACHWNHTSMTYYQWL
jgi:hypothetical protein